MRHRDQRLLVKLGRGKAISDSGLWVLPLLCSENYNAASSFTLCPGRGSPSFFFSLYFGGSHAIEEIQGQGVGGPASNETFDLWQVSLSLNFSFLRCTRKELVSVIYKVSFPSYLQEPGPGVEAGGFAAVEFTFLMWGQKTQE